MIKFQCPHPDCQKTHSAPFEMAGLKFPCKGCHRRLQIPGRLPSTPEEERTFAGVQVPLTRDAIRYACPNCTRGGEVSRDYQGKPVRCRACGGSFVVNGSPVEVPETAPDTLPPGKRPIRTGQKQRPGGAPWRFVLLLGLVAASVAGVGGYWWWSSRATPVPPAANPNFGIVEIGGKSVKALAIEVLVTTEGQDFKIHQMEGKDQIDFDGIGMAAAVKDKADGTVSDAKLEALAAKLKEFAARIAEKGVPRMQTYVVCSTGVLESLKGKSEAVSKCKESLTRVVREATGRELDFISETDEPRLAHVCCVPKSARGSTLLIDIGGGNTKGGSFDDQGQFYPLAMGIGSGLLESEVKKAGGTPEAAKGLREGKVAAAIKEAASDSPGARNRQKVYFIGAAAWGWTKFARPEATGLRTEMLPEDVDRYHALLYSSDDVREIKKKALERVKDPEARKRAEAEMDRVTRLPLGYLRAGAEILMALKQELKLEGRELITFDKGNIAWPLGYLLEKAQQQR